MKTVAYLRVSTKEQANSDRFGLQSQRDVIETFADKNDYHVDEWFVDKGQSGSKLDRPALQDLLNYAGHTPCRVIVSYTDRWARDTFLYHFLNKELLAAQSELVSATEESLNGDSPHEQLMANITIAFAQFERQRITSRMVGGRRQKAKAGELATGRIPYGFAKREDGKIERVPEEARAIHYIFGLREKGESLRSIADTLNNADIQTNKKWSASSVSYILKNETYKGKIRQTVGGEEIIVYNELFKLVD